jgi:hypothetical protein
VQVALKDGEGIELYPDPVEQHEGHAQASFCASSGMNDAVA